MATTMTLTQLIAAVRQRADQETSTFVTDAELTSYINQSYFELYDLLVTLYGNNYYVAAPVTFTTDGTNQLFALPNGTNFSAAPAFYKLLGVDLQLGTNSYVTLNQFQFSQRNQYSYPNAQSYYGVTNLRYRLQGDNIWLNPLPSSGQVIQLWYVPRMTQLSAGSDTADGISGWTEYIICDGAIKCMQKEESDVSILMAQKGDLVRRIEASAENRNASEPQRVSEVMGYYYDGEM